ncbi:MAG: cytochrome c oxidase accessory protein CcoG [Flavobacteriales bacterium]|jgi:cytochrome c oxidase accessory protein FixG|nr:cytochrome c oxidase accessory protein CcoG [Flavobacteriales bacterium]MBT6174491.1 cytochrome c oxidase accessory protein CcoG [Flavobacteriales bacterium]
MSHKAISNPDEFRDHISTVNQDGGRIWVYPRYILGKFLTRRKVVAYTLWGFLVAGPWIKVGGEPLMLFNLVERKFIIFGQIFWPQDTYLFVFAMLVFFLGVIVFTVVFGRLFCGWICPQTIFLEFIFRPIERFFEGDSPARIRLDKSDWTYAKFIRKSGKHISFFFISFFIANTFLAYVIGTEQLLEIITDSPFNHLAGLWSMMIFTIIFYWVFSRLREQVCSTICPYGRLQGVLIDSETVNVAYDYKRGEPRSLLKRTKTSLEPKGDCIDCSLCVQVCPTGIDIRNGLQLECIHCTACIDACDSIMDKVNKPRGLITYASENSLRENKSFSLSNRTRAYVGVLGVLSLVMLGLLFMRTSIELNVFRTPGMLYQVSESGEVSNLYHFVLVNKTSEVLGVVMVSPDENFEIEIVGNDYREIVLKPGVITEGVMFIRADIDEIDVGRNKIELRLMSGEQMYARSNTEFPAPFK